MTKSEALERELFWRSKVKKWRESDLSQSDFCRWHKLKLHQLSYWKNRFCDSTLDEPDNKFVPVTPVLTQPSGDEACLKSIYQVLSALS